MRSVLAAPPLLTIAQVAKRLNISPSATANLIHRGELRCVKLGAGLRAPVRVDEADLETYIQKHKRGGESPSVLSGRRVGPGTSGDVRAARMRALATSTVESEFLN